MAYAGAKFGNAVLCGLAGIETTECAYIMRGRREELPFMASKVTFGSNGVKEAHSLGVMNSYEQGRLQEALKQLKEEIDAGLAYAKTTKLACRRGWWSGSRPAAIPSRPTPAPSVRLSPDERNTRGNFKVCVCGGAGGIGQPLSMLMAQNPHVSELCVFDLTLAMVPAEGVAADLSHLEMKSKVKGYALDKDDKPIEKLQECLTGCHLVLVPAGMPRKPGMTRADLLGVNAGIAKNIVEACAKFCPDAVLGLIVNPVNSVVPAMCELYRKAGFDPRKICGVTSLDIVRANKFVQEITGVPLETIDVPVVGGHAGATILPLFSQVPAVQNLSADQIAALDKHVQDAGTDVVNAKGGKGSATLSMAYAGAKFGNAVLCGLAGIETTECAYVIRDVAEGAQLPYMASKVTFGPGGVKQAHALGGMNRYEETRLAECVKQLKDEIDAGVAYAQTVSLA
jgi:malate dehydrogenase